MTEGKREPSGLLLYGFERTELSRFSGESCEDPPVPIPNTEVKLTNAESTRPEAAREDRKLLIKEKTLERVSFFYVRKLPIFYSYLPHRQLRDLLYF